MSWGKITRELYPFADSKEIKYLRPMLWMIVKDGYFPKDNKTRNRLHLVPLKGVEACPTCNQVHIGRCPEVDPDELPAKYKMVEICPNCGEVHTLGDICPHETPVRIVVQRNHRPKRKRYLTDLPPDTTPEQREVIRSMSKSERLAAMLAWGKD